MVKLSLYAMQGEYDNLLKRLVQARFTIELLNGGKNREDTCGISLWKKPEEQYISRCSPFHDMAS